MSCRQPGLSALPPLSLRLLATLAIILASAAAGGELNLQATARDGVTLVGTLTLPEGPGPFPAVVFTHGSEPGRRSSRAYRRWSDAFGEQGFATLVFDKRGCGDSEGSYVEAPDLQVPSDDLIAWVDLLAKRTDVRSESIGVLGWSQGGWVGPLAASRSDRIAWVVAISGPGVSPLEQNIYDKTNRFAASGATDDQIARFSETIRRVWTYLATGADRAEAQEAWDQLENEPYFDQYDGPPMMDRDTLLRHPRMLSYEAHSNYEPAPVLASLTVPMLAVFGSEDRVVPVERSVEVMEEAFASSGRPSLLTTRVIPGADHGLRVEKDGGRQLPFEVIDDIVQWARDRVAEAGIDRLPGRGSKQDHQRPSARQSHTP